MKKLEKIIDWLLPLIVCFMLADFCIKGFIMTNGMVSEVRGIWFLTILFGMLFFTLIVIRIEIHKIKEKLDKNENKNENEE